MHKALTIQFLELANSVANLFVLHKDIINANKKLCKQNYVDSKCRDLKFIVIIRFIFIK